MIDLGQKKWEQATPASNQRPNLQNPTPQRDRRITLRTRVQGGEGQDRGEWMKDEEAHETAQELYTQYGKRERHGRK